MKQITIEKKVANAGVLFVTFITLFVASFPVFVEAQWGGRRGGESSAYRSKINDLDDDPVEKLYIPILFGVTLSSIYPSFGDDRDGGDRSHEGLDIMAPEGAPVISPTEAVVIRTGSGEGSGKYVYTANPGGETFRYMHLEEILVKSGDELEEGDIIGYVGNTGNASGGPAHLHFEVRDGGEALDPFPRISREFTLAEKIEFLDEALTTVDDEEELVEFVIENYGKELQLARASGITLPKDIVSELPVSVVVAPNSSGVTASGDLELGSQGPLVVTLQRILIATDIGPAAKALAEATATGYFGSVTQRALIEYQLANGITPAAGYFGPKTRAFMQSGI